MKLSMKKVLFIGLVALATLSSCARKYTCPTYSKATGAEHMHASITKADKGNH